MDAFPFCILQLGVGIIYPLVDTIVKYEGELAEGRGCS